MSFSDRWPANEEQIYNNLGAILRVDRKHLPTPRGRDGELFLPH